MACLQTALSMVRDRSEDIGRTTKRVAYVLEFLQRPEKRGKLHTYRDTQASNAFS